MILRTLLSLIMLLALPNFSGAQESIKQKPFIYGEISGMFGTIGGVDMRVDLITPTKFCLSVGLVWGSRDPLQVPDDYSPGLLALLGNLATQGLAGTKPKEDYGTLFALAGKSFDLNRAGTIRFNPQLGFAFIERARPVFFRPIDGNGFLFQNYEIDYDRSSHLGLFISPKLEFPIAKGFGFLLNPTAQISGAFTLFGMQAGILFGRLRKRANR